MDNGCDWARIVASEVRKAEAHISPADQQHYRLPLLLRLARQVAGFSPECEICRSLQSQIIELSVNLAEPPRMTNQGLRNRLDIVKGIAKHLKRRHGLVEERHYVKRYVSIALSLGIALVLLGLILLNFGITLLALNITLTALVTRVMFGCMIGYFLDRRARKRGRVL